MLSGSVNRPIFCTMLLTTSEGKCSFLAINTMCLRSQSTDGESGGVADAMVLIAVMASRHRHHDHHQRRCRRYYFIALELFSSRSTRRRVRAITAINLLFCRRKIKQSFFQTESCCCCSRSGRRTSRLRLGSSECPRPPHSKNIGGGGLCPKAADNYFM